ncbi:MAG: 50S ribosomal protein L40e [Candidatus Nitrosoabyssus spongiisocia]|nr:MAG: 50S ribosomal protein L40e [Nitrosopumilaceae archaeon AB1(1)]
MPITNPLKKRIAQQARLYMRICFNCGVRNPLSATRCRKCHNAYLRLKNRTLGIKK